MSAYKFMRCRLARIPLLLSCVGVGALTLGSLAGTDAAAASASGAGRTALQPNHLLATHAGHGHGGKGSSCGTGSTSLGWASSNWSGYAETCSVPYTAITGSWQVPSVSGPDNSYSATWIGIDGFNNNSLIQTGTEQDVSSDGTPMYSAWWTTSSNHFVEQTITNNCTTGNTSCGHVAAGDAISATITETNTSTSAWSITIADGTQWSFTESLTYTGQRASAEWIVEAPTVGGRIATLANYNSPLTFNPDTIGAATINGSASPALTYSDGGEMVAVSGRGKFAQQQVVSIPSPPDSDADGFAIAYGMTAPAAPSS